ncbi:MAG: site-specific integrase [Tannerellaceae bacterium]|jgi:site-specific recombinase XerD|nr:site-specific integrase [Tannerellaceae bacterium]
MSVFKVVQKKINKRGEGPIYITFYIGRKKVEIPARFSLAPSDFDKERGIVKQSHPFCKDKNLILSNIKSRINDIFVKFRLRGIDMTEDHFWSAFHNPGNFDDFFDFCSYHQKLRFPEISENTIKRDKSALKMLKEFKSPLYFDQLTITHFRQFILYLRNKKGNKENTIKKTIVTISLYINEALKQEYISENPIKQIKMRGFNQNSTVFLTSDEFKKVIDLHNSRICTGTTENVLDFFLFMCFTSLHISDARGLQIDQISEGQLTYMRMKTRNSRPRYITIPLSESAKKIIRRWVGDRKKGYIFEGLISNVKINKHLKTIGDMAGVKKKLCAKVGRHTFATLFLRETKDLNALKELLGHSNIKETLIYAHVLDEDRKKGIETFNQYAI